MNTVPVTAALIMDRTGRVLIAQRGDLGSSNKWEFPGGKLQAGESPEECLERELAEELGIRVRVGDVFHVAHCQVGSRWVLLLAYLCEWEDGILSPREHKDFKWVGPDELLALELLEPDRIVALKWVQRRGEIVRIDS